MQIRRRIERFRAQHAKTLGWVIPVLWLAALALFGLWLFTTFRVVTVRSAHHGTRVLLTTSPQPQQWLAEAGLTAGPQDELITSAIYGGTLLELKPSFPSSLSVDGQVYTYTFTGGTVADLLEAAGAELGPDDFVQPEATTPLSGSTMARVHRVEYVEELRREDVDPEVLAGYLAELDEGTEFIESTNGLTYDILYRDKLVDGAVAESQLLELIPVFEAPAPRPADSYTLQYGVPNSRIEGYDDIAFGPDGLPLGYARVMRGAVTTAYSASRGRGSSGLGLYCGTVAVNPNVIPYGTRMWITDSRQNFIYGFAIATDTGTAMMEGRVDIDLFFESNAECLQFGKRQLDVYIFGPPPKAEPAQ